MKTLFSWNLNGFRSLLKKDNFIFDNTTFLDFISNCNYDYIALQETKIRNPTTLSVLNNSYKFIYSTSTNNSRSGVAILSKTKAKKVVYDLGQTSLEYLGRYIELEFDTHYLVNIYAPNSGENLKNLEFRTLYWDKIFLDRLLTLKKTKKEIIICGDFNVVQHPNDTWNFKVQRNKLAGVTDIERYNFNKLIENGFYNIFHEKYKTKTVFTYFTYLFNARKYNKGMVLDYILTTKKLVDKVKYIKILDNIRGSDHLPILVKIDI